MRRISLLSLVLLASAFLGGCASAPYMPWADDAAAVDPAKPVYLMSVTVKNDYKERWQPRILNVIVEKPGEGGKSVAQAFRMDPKGTVSSDSGQSTYLVRFPAETEQHTVLGFNSMASAFPIHGFYFVPLHASVAQSAGGIYYLGSVKASIRERNEGEFRAGPPIPLIDQAIAGASTGTFEVEITDAYDADVALFRKTFSGLAGADIKKAVLPPWDRAKAQRFWEAN